MSGPIDIRAIHERHRWLMRSLENDVEAALEEAGRHAEWTVVEKSTFRHRSNAVRDGTRTRVQRTRGARRLVITNVARHAAYLEYGTRPHIIRAKRGRSLSFFWLRVSKRMVIRQVRHPGTKPYHFLRFARDQAFLLAGVLLHKALIKRGAQF